MPGFDRTGPRGQGPRTGRQMGKCVPKKGNEGHLEDEYERRGPRWFGRGRGFGWGWGRRAGGGPGRGLGRGRGWRGPKGQSEA